MNRPKDNDRAVLIVGAGASGFACVLALSSKGIKTIIVDRRPEQYVVEKTPGARSLLGGYLNLLVHQLILTGESMQKNQLEQKT